MGWAFLVGCWDASWGSVGLRRFRGLTVGTLGVVVGLVWVA